MEGVNLNIKEKSIIIEFNDLSSKMKAKTRCLSRADISIIQLTDQNVIECTIVNDLRGWTIAGNNYNGEIPVLVINKVNGINVTTEELLEHLYDFKNG